MMTEKGQGKGKGRPLKRIKVILAVCGGLSFLDVIAELRTEGIWNASELWIFGPISDNRLMGNLIFDVDFLRMSILMV